MLIKVNDGLSPQIGMAFVRYHSNGNYERGEIIELKPETIIVDYLDYIYEYPRSEISCAFGVANGEHLMTTAEGIMVRDYRITPST